ncbi:glycosyltransferase [Simiduia aestuariiviva]|uniref:Glycosyltransferase involved in cell wall biosynthesis n=1 Tax=Simiduia aestuariiviva TaxID=1510459 RepID=A0A839UQH5_9GAMM|nr:glycosyltransferase involved in cell wall biosynthesis [Simiduia aestuariiviva]
MNIVILVDALHSIAAGSERQIYKLVSGLCQQGHRVKLVVLRHTPFTETLTSFPCPIVDLDIHHVARPKTLQTLLRFRRQLIQDQVDVLHAWLPESCLLAPLLLKHARLKVITSRRDMGLIYRGKPAWLYRMVRRRTDTVISNSRAVAQHVSQQERLPATQSKVIYNGLDDFTPSATGTQPIFNDTNAIKLILVANIKPVKRTLDAVNAVAALHAQGIAVELALVGEPQDSAYVASIHNHIAAQQLASHIHWLGSVNEPRQLLSQADIGLLVSESEGLSNTLMEYMQAGLPVVATRVGGNPELIQHQHNGMLIEKGDVAELAQAIQTLHQNPTLKTQFSERNKARIAADFTMANMIAKHLAAYDQAPADSVRTEKAPC